MPWLQLDLDGGERERDGQREKRGTGMGWVRVLSSFHFVPSYSYQDAAEVFSVLLLVLLTCVVTSTTADLRGN